MKCLDVHQDLRNPLYQVNAICALVRIAAQSTGEELRPEVLYEAMLAVQDILDTALAGLQPLIDEDEQYLQDALQHVREGRA